MQMATFIVFALLALGSAVVVVSHRSPIYSVISLVVTLFSLAVLFVLLGAPFIAALEVLIYAGAILVLFLFVVMLLNVGRERAGVGMRSGQRWAAVLAAAVFAGSLGMLVWRSYAGEPLAPLSGDAVSLTELARALFGRYLLPFEIIGLLLLAAVIAATVLARRLAPGEILDGAPPPGGGEEAGSEP